jgi:hypothetical protein
VDATDEHGDIADRQAVIDLGSYNLPGIPEVAHVLARAFVAAIHAPALAYREERAPFPALSRRLQGGAARLKATGAHPGLDLGNRATL